MLEGMKTEIAATPKVAQEQASALRPVAIRQLQEQEKGDEVAKGTMGSSRTWRCFDDLEQRLNAEIKSMQDGNQSLTIKTLDLQSQQDEVVQMQDAASKVGTEVEALTVELGAPPRIRTIEDAVVPLTRDEKKRMTMIGMIIFGSFFGGLFGIAFLELQQPEGRFRRRSPDRPGASGGRHLADRACPEPARRMRSHAEAKRMTATGITSCWNRSMPPGRCWSTRPARGRTEW